MVEQRSPMASPSPAHKRPVLSTRRSTQPGVAMSLEKRPPRELLNQIGISGKDVVKIIKERNWVIEEPHGLQQQNIYHLPGSKTKGGKEKQNIEYFVGEGELYAFILKQGGARYLLPDESDVSDIEPTQPRVSMPLKPSQSSKSVEENRGVERTMEEKGGLALTIMMNEQRKWKRRKKLSTASSNSVETTTLVSEQSKASKRSSSADTSTAEEQDNNLVDPRVKREQTAYGNISQLAEFKEYEASWKAKGWRAQLLQDIDVHLLRSVAAVDRQHRADDTFKEGQKTGGRPIKQDGPHAQDATEILQEMDRLLYSVRASQKDISSMIDTIIAEAERIAIPDRVDSIGRIGIPGFVSTGAGTLMLMRDIERYLLLVVAAVRRYQRARKAYATEKCANGLIKPTGPAVQRTKLRALQLSIEESKRELQELATIIAADARKSYMKDVQPGIEQSTFQGAS